MTKNATLYTNKAKNGKTYIKVCLHIDKEKSFDFCVSPRFLNKKQYAYLMTLLGVKNEKE